MSVPVALDRLGDALAAHPWGYLVTVGDGGRAHLLAVPTRFVDGRLVMQAGRGSRSNADARAEVTMVFPPASGTEYSLIVDGLAETDDGGVTVVPTNAVLHRPALASDG